MEIKNKTVESFYETINEDERLKRKKVNQIEFLTTVRFLDSVIEPKSKILDACAGSGIYSFYFAKKEHEVYSSDLIEKNVECIRKNQEAESQLKEISTGSILDLSRYKDDSFDVVLNLGSFYHLLCAEQRYKSLKESLRVLKKGGIYALAYINKYANIIKYRDMFVEDYYLLNEYLKNGYHRKNEVFYASTPEDVENELMKHAVQIKHNIATDGMKFIIRDTVNRMNDLEFDRWLDFHILTCEERSILGTSEHGMIIAKKG